MSHSKMFNAVTELREEVDMVALRLIRDNFSEVYKILRDSFKKKMDENTAFTMINRFYISKCSSFTTYYYYSRNSESGRRIAKYSLQDLCRQLRHTISKHIYHDLDIQNAHPTFLLDLCNKLNFKHPILKSYIDKREEKLKVWGDLINKNRDDTKQYFLSIINGGGNNSTESEELNNFYDRHQEFLDKFYKLPAYKKYAVKAVRKQKKESSWNVKGSALNLYLNDVEDDVLKEIEFILKKNSIEYGTLCFDGIMIYQNYFKKSKKTILDIILETQNHLKDHFGYDIFLKVKDMNEDIDLSGFVAKDEIKTDELTLATIVLDVFKDDYKYDREAKKLWFWDDTEKLWLRQSMSYFAVLMVPILENYIKEHPDKDEVKELLNEIRSNTLTTNILAHITRRVETQRHDDFIHRYFNKAKGLFPIANGLVVDLHTNETRLREKTDYFTMASSIAPEPVSDEGRDKLMNYVRSILMTDNQIYIDYFLTCIAYTMTGENNKKLVVNLIGDRDGGKSLFLRLMGEMMGGFSGPVNERVVVLKKNESVHDSELLALSILRNANISELAKKQLFNVKLLKAISGGDAIDARGAGKLETTKLLLQCVLWIATNEMAQFNDEAFASRLSCFHFKNKFEKNPAVEREMISLCPQFFSLVCEYAQRYYESGEILEQCEEVKSYTNEVVASRDSVSMFMKTFKITQNDSDYITRNDMFDRYFTFCEEEGVRADGKSTFYSKLEKVIGEVKQIKRTVGKQTTNIRGYKSVKWIDDDNVETEGSS